MKYLASALICLTLTSLAAAQGEPLGPDAVRPSPGAPALVGPSELELRLAPAQAGARRTRLAAISLAGTGAALTLTGGLLWGLHNESDGALGSGIVFVSVGGAALLASIYTGINAAGRQSGVHELKRIELADPGDRLALLDAAEHRERRKLYIGLGVFVTSIVFFGAGTAMALVGFGNPFEGGPNNGNGGMFGVGVALSVTGDAMYAAGSGLMVYHGGKGSALRAGRSTVSLAPTGVMGTF